MQINTKLEPKKNTGGFLGWVERVGNKIPHPFILFLWLIVILWIISFICAMAGVKVINPSTGDEVVAKNLLSAEGITFALTDVIKNFTGFAPLGLVLTMALGIGLAERIGFMSAFMKKTILGAPPKIVTFIIAVIGICGNLASDAAIIIVPAIAAMIFLSLGRNPLAGIALGYASTTAGFSANLLIAGTDGLLSGITNEASKIVNGIEIPVTANWYFMASSTIILAIIITWITERIIEPRLGKYTGKKQIGKEQLTPEENKALKKSGIAVLIYLAILVIVAAPKNSFLRNPKTGSLISGSTLMSGIIPLLLILFLVAAISYGKAMGKIKTSGDIPKYMGLAIKDMAPFIVLAFIIGQFIAYFNWSNLGYILAVKGADTLKAAGFTGIPLFISFIIFTTFINIFIGSGSAKWALLAPIFVPMFYLLGYHPALTQMFYRIGDSATNIISPLFPYFPIILGFFNEYDEEAGVGTVLSLMIPYSMIMLVAWIVLGIIWYVAGLPLGPGGGLLL